MSPLTRALATAYLLGRLDATQRILSAQSTDAKSDKAHVPNATLRQHDNRDVLRNVQAESSDT